MLAIPSFQLLVRGALTFARHLKLTYQAAVLCDDAGFSKEAGLFADRGIKSAMNEADRIRFEQLKASLAKAN